ncbi:ABC transporter ATP-binding protein [Haemophilus parahaemolyticus]|jgi:ABC-type multidrug transport system, ATPase component|uniref:ABC transporter ATP-binding protein n=2 Tax=Haemophilus parahaemolyticus TaxID=735 RepID=A0AAE6MNE0_HAEPH|nr:ABC transporter ATP-binding protein [Haemophilus parahaemolyticus]EIJ69945.1 ABC transporter, ATP-binding protein [Haemophilus parahaemolyticus HK385]OOR97927.1 ABC transporter [Haemophilus parahaemolyticus]QEN10307.1 ABC transporter ATP-binding protein [Haemophilus parahaemolyticus]QRP13295.1 ABC transporter ATP-binding protein [Haemophilus parahaemolyticus]STO65833.1 ABC transporter ATP-binding protein [Haemophilus parahaemolyticus HK385]
MHALEIKNLIKTYATGVQAVKGIDLTVEQGDFYALLGHNGAGKSTTIGIISSLVNKTSGSVKVFGYDLDTQKTQLKQQIGLVPQEFNFNQFEKVVDVLTQQAGFYGIPLKEAKARAEIWLKKLDLWEKRTHLTRELSGGMKRRVMIARALMHNPKLLILDEPTAGVDIELRRSLWDFLRELNQQGTTIILTTHYLEEAENLCRNIGIIQHGKLIENTSMKSLLAKLETEIFVLDLQNMPQNRPLVIEHYPHKLLDENTLEVEVQRAQGLTNLFTQLTAQNVEVLSMRNKSNRLEELFLKMAN